MSTSSESQAPPNKELVGALLKACSLLDHFGADRPEWTLNELTAVSGMNKTTIHRLMATLIHAGWVDRTGDGAYRVTVRLFEIGSSALAELDLRSAARPHLLALAAGFGDTAYLMVPADEGAVCIDKVDGTGSLVVAGINIGTVLPYHAAAGPVVMLANSPALRDRWVQEGLTRFTSRTMHDPGALAAHLDRVRDAGYSLSESDYLDGVSAVAAPVRDQTGAVVGSISVGGRAENFTGPTLDAKIEQVTRAALRVSSVVQAAAG
ncbi:IclR family transcriptional regulator [Dietzia lutea]|uniref:IclR family transcriptional regulator n=1 Tax=Dietzia lutea TaxID=546160 RepID=A0A2S1R5N9_9ACTN|nr:IclR family transcriptional regulator [Dietzia lutea]AWH91564.1 IclR family transcriptional regulator [Dietzia lutea]